VAPSRHSASTASRGLASTGSAVLMRSVAPTIEAWASTTTSASVTVSTRAARVAGPHVASLEVRPGVETRRVDQFHRQAGAVHLLFEQLPRWSGGASQRHDHRHPRSGAASGRSDAHHRDAQLGPEPLGHRAERRAGAHQARGARVAQLRERRPYPLDHPRIVGVMLSRLLEQVRPDEVATRRRGRDLGEQRPEGRRVRARGVEKRNTSDAESAPLRADPRTGPP